MKLPRPWLLLAAACALLHSLFSAADVAADHLMMMEEVLVSKYGATSHDYDYDDVVVVEAAASIHGVPAGIHDKLASAAADISTVDRAAVGGSTGGGHVTVGATPGQAGAARPHWVVSVCARHRTKVAVTAVLALILVALYAAVLLDNQRAVAFVRALSGAETAKGEGEEVVLTKEGLKKVFRECEVMFMSVIATGAAGLASEAFQKRLNNVVNMTIFVTENLELLAREKGSDITLRAWRSLYTKCEAILSRARKVALEDAALCDGGLAQRVGTRDLEELLSLLDKLGAVVRASKALGRVRRAVLSDATLRDAADEEVETRLRHMVRALQVELGSGARSSACCREGASRVIDVLDELRLHCLDDLEEYRLAQGLLADLVEGEERAEELALRAVFANDMTGLKQAFFSELFPANSRSLVEGSLSIEKYLQTPASELVSSELLLGAQSEEGALAEAASSRSSESVMKMKSDWMIEIERKRSGLEKEIRSNRFLRDQGRVAAADRRRADLATRRELHASSAANAISGYASETLQLEAAVSAQRERARSVYGRRRALLRSRALVWNVALATLCVVAFALAASTGDCRAAGRGRLDVSRALFAKCSKFCAIVGRAGGSIAAADAGLLGLVPKELLESGSGYYRAISDAAVAASSRALFLAVHLPPLLGVRSFDWLASGLLVCSLRVAWSLLMPYVLSRCVRLFFGPSAALAVFAAGSVFYMWRPVLLLFQDSLYLGVLLAAHLLLSLAMHALGSKASWTIGPGYFSLRVLYSSLLLYTALSQGYFSRAGASRGIALRSEAALHADSESLYCTYRTIVDTVFTLNKY